MRQSRVARFNYGDSPSVCHAATLAEVGKTIYIHESKYGRCVFLVLFIGLLLGIVLVASKWLLICLMPYIFWQWRYIIALYVDRTASNATRVLVADCDVWHVVLHNGRRFRGRFIKRLSNCNEVFLVWHVKCYTYNWSLLIFRDAVSEAEYRYLASRFHCR